MNSDRANESRSRAVSRNVIGAAFSPAETPDGRIRDLALFDFAIGSKLGGCAPKQIADAEN